MGYATETYGFKPGRPLRPPDRLFGFRWSDGMGGQNAQSTETACRGTGGMQTIGIAGIALFYKLFQ